MHWDRLSPEIIGIFDKGRGELDTGTSTLFSYSISSLIFLGGLFGISFAFSSSIQQNITALIAHSKGRGEPDTNTSKLLSYSIIGLILLVYLFRINSIIFLRR